MASTKVNVEVADAQQELLRLNKEYRYMEVDRKSYGELSQNLIRKQRATIERWKKENDHIRKELMAIESRQQAAETDATLSKRLQELSEENDRYQTKMSKSQESIADLDAQIRLMRDRVRDLKESRKNMGFSVNPSVEISTAVSKQIRVLENRLDKALIKFNEALSNNKKLREQIDNLRRERVVFDGIYKKLEKELIEKKKKMAKIIEQSNSAYDARDMAQDAMNKLKEQHIKDMSQLENEMMECARVLKFERRVKNFIGIKETDRQLQHRSQSENKKTRKGYGSKNRSQLDIVGEKVKTYEEAFDKIHAATGITDTDELVSTFIEVEDQNFSLFNFVNDLQSEIEKLEEKIHDMKTDIDTFKVAGETQDNERRLALKTLSERLAKTEAKTDQYEDKHASATSIMTDLRKAILELFNSIGCNSEAVAGVLQDAAVTESNVMQYLSIVEQRATEILQATATLNPTANELDGSRPRAKPVVSTTTSARAHRFDTSQLPSTFGDGGDHDDEMSDSLDEEAQRPLTREELRARSLRELSRPRANRGGRVRGGGTLPKKRSARKY